MTISRMQGKVGIIFALASEAQGLERVLAESFVQTRTHTNLTSWFIGKTELVIAISGIGRERCAKTTSSLINSGVQWVISAGLAGGLHPEANVGDVLIANNIISSICDSNLLECSNSLISASPPSGSFGFPICQGNVVTVDNVVCSASEKQTLYKSTGAAALDMESYAAAMVCSRYNVPFAAVKSISDTSTQNLPTEIADMISLNGRINQALYAATRPKLWIPLNQLRKQSNTAIANLSDVLALMLLRLL